MSVLTRYATLTGLFRLLLLLILNNKKIVVELKYLIENKIQPKRKVGSEMVRNGCFLKKNKKIKQNIKKSHRH